jgi:uncharacterized protein (TIRG00374 family)
MKKQVRTLVKHKIFWLFWGLFFLAVWFIAGHFVEIKDLVKTIAEGQWQWILLAILIQCLYYCLFTFQVINAFDVVEIRNRFKELIFVILSGNFVNVVAPIGGAGGAALYVDDAVRRGYPVGRATAGTLLSMISDFTASGIILLVGLTVLAQGHNITSIEQIAAVIYFLVLFFLILLIFLARLAPEVLHGLMDFGEKIIHMVASAFKNDPFKKGWANRATTDFVAASEGLARHPYYMFRSIAFGFIGYCFEIVGLLAIFHAFHQPVDLPILIAGYAIASLFWKISITPQGIGFVEAAMTLVYTQLGIPSVKATIIALSFRGITFWLPFFVGFLTFRKMRIFEMPKDS